MRFDREKLEKRINTSYHIAAWLIIGVGIALRLTLYIQNRNFIIDEANIARNLYERGFAGLLKPLSYEQAAPPLFLWIEEVLSLLFGYGEQALKLYPLLAGIASLFLLRRVLLYFVPVRSILLPLAILAFTYYNVRYATELKQYIPDQMITLLLLWLALRTDITLDRKRFIITWGIAGSLAIWASMPAVFILCGAGAYYGWLCMRHKSLNQFLTLSAVSLIWIVQFAVYYLLLLKQQSEWGHMLRYHEQYFLFAWPDNEWEWAHNKMRIDEIIYNIGGRGYYSYYLVVIFMSLGTIILLYKHTARLLLVAVPIILTILAAAFNKFSLIDRVILFMVPLQLVLLSCGFELLMKPRFLLWQLFMLYTGVYMLKYHNELKFFRERIISFSITPLLDTLLREHVKGDQLYVHISAQATYIYYTEIHAGHAKYSSLRGAYYLQWNDQYNAVLRKGSDTAYFVYCSGISPEELSFHEREIRTEMVPFIHFRVNHSYGDVYGYHTKPAFE